MAIIEGKEKVYTDVDLSFQPNPFTKDIVTLVNEKAVFKSIRHALFFNKYDIPFDNSNYSSVKSTLFEPVSYVSSAVLASNIKFIVEKLDRRIVIKDIDVSVNPTEDGYNVTIIFDILYYKDDLSISIFLQRIR